MPRRVEQIAADFDALTPRDFDVTSPSANGWERLHVLCEELEAIGDIEQCAPVLFRTMERLDGQDLGSPGPLVHTLESWRGGYEPFLGESMRRKPTALSVWMVNRLLNSDPADTELWLSLLRSVSDHPAATEVTKMLARDFLSHQAGT